MPGLPVHMANLEDSQGLQCLPFLLFQKHNSNGLLLLIQVSSYIQNILASRQRLLGRHGGGQWPRGAGTAGHRDSSGAIPLAAPRHRLLM